MAKQQPSAPRRGVRPQDKNAFLRRCAILLLCIGLVFGTVLSAVSVRSELLQKKYRFIYGGSLQKECLFDLTIDAESVRKYVREMDRHGQTRKFAFFCNDTLAPDTMNGLCAIMFGSPDTNDCILILSIYDENGDMLYRSDGVEPGKYISQIRLVTDMENGAHTCRAYVTAYDRDNYACIGVQYTDLTVQIGGGA